MTKGQMNRLLQLALLEAFVHDVLQLRICST